MDIILGAIGAFFFLLIILSASRRGLVQEGSLLPPNMMTINVEQPSELNVGESIHYFVAQLKNDTSNEIEKIFYSDVAIDTANKNKLVEVSDTSLAIPSILATDEPKPTIIVGLWLQDVLSNVLPNSELRKHPILLTICCKKFNREPLKVELKYENNYFTAYKVNSGTVYDVAELRYNGQPLIRVGLPCRSGGESWTPIQKIGDDVVNASIENVYVNNEYNPKYTEKRFFYKDTGFIKLENKKVIFRFVGGFNHQHEDTNRDPRDAVLNYLKKLEGEETKSITYLAVGYRAVCAVTNDGLLRFQILCDYQYSWSGQSYPFTKYPKGIVSKEDVKKMIDQMRKVEPELSNDDDEQLKRMLAEIIAGPNTRKTPYPVVRQNPLLWNLP
jgi:hypothetical protein